MRNLIYLFGILSITLALSCKPVKTVTEFKEIVTHDTIRDTTVIVKFQAVHDTLTIDNPCDSAGILTNFYSKITIPQGKVVVRSYKGKIQATVNIDSIQSVYESKYKSFVGKSDTNTQNFVRTNVIPTWIIMVVFFETMIILIYLYFKFIFPK